MSKRSNEKESRHVRLYHWILKTEAWRDLDPVARCVYVELASRYGGPGSNNGSIPCSVRDLSEALSIGKATAHKALASLMEHGFIAQTVRGGFNMNHRQATQWLLTEFKDDRKGGELALPLKTFAAWRKTKPSSVSDTHKYLRPNEQVSQAEQSPKGTMAYGSATGTEGPFLSSATGTLLSYQGRRR